MHDAALGLDELKAHFAGQYDIERELVGGGMSRLLLATERTLGRRVVIKLLPPELTSAVGAARFRRETEVTARLQHPNILPILSAGQQGDLLYYVMPYVAGESLRARMAREGALAVPEALRLLVEVADALACAHDAGVVHRDLKPENVLLQSGHALLADFGVASAFGEGTRPGDGGRITRTGTSPGTVGYMAPEQLAGDAEVGARADVYALGVVAWELLAGRPLFEADTAQALLAAHLVDEPERLDVVRLDVPGHVARAVARALEKQPESRWPRAADFRDALQRSLAAVMTASGQVERDPLGERMKVAVRRFRSSTSTRRLTGPQPAARPRWPALVAVLVMVAAGGGAFYVHRARATAPTELVTIAVAPFRVLRADLMPEAELWREGIVDVMARNLDGAGTLRTVAPARVLRGGRGPVAQRDAAAFARDLGARYALVGEFVPTSGDSVRIKAWLVSSGDTVVFDPEWRLPVREAVDSLSFAVVRRLGELHRIGAVSGTPSLTTTSAVALRDFLRGEQHYRRTAWDSASALYDRAIAADSTFALALWRASLVRTWQRNGDDSTAAANALRAGRFVHGLSPRDSLLVTADSISAALTGARTRGATTDWRLRGRLFATVNEAVARYPDDPEVWFTVGEARFHHGFGSVGGVTERQALEAFDRAIRLDSSFAPAYVHAVSLALVLDGAEAAARYARPYLAMRPVDRHADAVRLIDRLVALPPGPERVSLLDSVPTPVLETVTWTLIRWPDPAQTAYEVLRTLDRRLRRDAPGFGARLLQLQLLMSNGLAYRGRFSDAYAAMGDRRWRLFAELAQLGGIPPQFADSALRDWLPAAPGQVAPALPWWAARRDTAVIARFLAHVQPLARTAGDEAARRRWTYQLQAGAAYLALARADTARAVAGFGQLPDTLCENCYADRLTRARLLASRGRHAEALAVLDERLYVAITPLEILFHFERGRALAALGRSAEAREAYGRVIAAWDGGDPPARDWVRRARAATAALAASRQIVVR